MFTTGGRGGRAIAVTTLDDSGQGSDNIGGNPDGDIIVDHCSVSWARDEGISLYRHMKTMPDGSQRKYPVKNLTIQWVVSTETLGPGHEFGGTWGGGDATSEIDVIDSYDKPGPVTGARIVAMIARVGRVCARCSPLAANGRPAAGIRILDRVLAGNTSPATSSRGTTR